jgi:hypothetical protein
MAATFCVLMVFLLRPTFPAISETVRPSGSRRTTSASRLLNRLSGSPLVRWSVDVRLGSGCFAEPGPTTPPTTGEPEVKPRFSMARMSARDRNVCSETRHPIFDPSLVRLPLRFLRSHHASSRSDRCIACWHRTYGHPCRWQVDAYVKQDDIQRLAPRNRVRLSLCRRHIQSSAWRIIAIGSTRMRNSASLCSLRAIVVSPRPETGPGARPDHGPIPRRLASTWLRDSGF